MVDVSTTHSNFFKSNYNGFENDIYLPNLLICSALTLNLISTSDVAKIANPLYNTISKFVLDKCNSFWNLLSRSTAFNEIQEMCNDKFLIPIIT